MWPWFLIMVSRWRLTTFLSVLQEPSHEEQEQPNLDVYERRQFWASYNLGGFPLHWTGQCWSGKPGLFPAELQLKCLQKTSVNDTKQMIWRETNKSEKESAQSLAKGNGNHTILDHSKATNNDATVLTNKDNTDKTDLLDLKEKVKSMMSFSESSAPGKRSRKSLQHLWFLDRHNKSH